MFTLTVFFCFLIFINSRIVTNEVDEKQAREVLLTLLGYARKPTPNKYNILNGATDTALNFMFDLYKDVIRHDFTHNHTRIEVNQFSGRIEVRNTNEFGTRKKRTTLVVADTAISFITESK